MRIDRLRRISTALLCGAVLGAASSQATTTIAQQIAVPAYFLPGAQWTQLNGSTPAVGLAVVNLANGPDYEARSEVASTIQAAHNAGIKVLGYVDTGYFGTTGQTTRLKQSGIEAWRSQIQQDVNAWYDFYGSYGLDGIFFDQGQNSCGTDNAYALLYQSVSNYVKHNHAGAVTALNPGIAVPQCYQNSADILLTFEGSYQCYIQDSSCPEALRYQSPGWNPVDPRKFWHLVYDTSELQVADAIDRSKQRSAGYIYITPKLMPNPWNELPTGTYWSAEQVGVAPGGTADTTAPTAPGTLDTVDYFYTWASLDWEKSTDAGSGVVAYDLFEGSGLLWSVPATASAMQTYTMEGLAPTSSHTVTVKARDAAGNVSASSNSLTFSTEPADGCAPTAPGTPSVSQVTYTSALLSWSASTDEDDTVAAYDVYRAGAKIMTVAAGTTSATVIGLQPGSTTSFTVKARDSEGNVSAASGAASVTTSSLPGGQPIVNPGGSFTSTAVTYVADYALPFASRRVFIDADNNPATGFQTMDIGADYFIENGLMYKHTGSGTGWDWDSASIAVTPSYSGPTTTWVVPVGDFTGVWSTTQRVFYQGDGFAPNTFSVTVTLTQS